MSWRDKRIQHKRWIIGTIGTTITSCLLLVWWQLAGPATLFRVQIWLLKHGAWGNIDHWIAHGDWYLPYLIEEADNIAPAPGYLMRETRAEDAFEAYAHYRMDTVSDWVRLALGELTGVDDGVGLTFLDGTTVGTPSHRFLPCYLYSPKGSPYDLLAPTRHFFTVEGLGGRRGFPMSFCGCGN